MKNVLIVIIVLAALIGGTVFFTNRNATDRTDDAATSDTVTPNASDLPATTEPPAPPPPTGTDNESATVITYGANGFSPASLTVKAGGQVTVKNDSSAKLDFASDPHPVHTENAELNQGEVAAGQSKTFTVNKTGTFGYHNHDNSSHTGTLIVQ